MRPKDKEQGSILVLSMIFAMVVSLGISGLIGMQVHYHKINAKQFDRTEALYKAESGIILALHELNHKIYSNRWGSGWAVNGTTYTYTDPIDATVYPINITGLT